MRIRIILDAFNGGISYDTTWRSSFGNIYKTNGSHGCVYAAKCKESIRKYNKYNANNSVVYTLYLLYIIYKK